jgi:hypothetical protein
LITIEDKRTAELALSSPAGVGPLLLNQNGATLLTSEDRRYE